MREYFTKFFDSNDFPPRWNCGTWSEFLGWLHIGSDLATFGAYFAIPLALVYFARKRKDFPFTRMFWLFAGFILACGTVHLIEAIIFWHPIYRVSGLMKFVTAVISWATVVALIQVIPKVLELPSLAATNRRLEEEATQRRQTETELRAAKARYEALLSGTRSIVWTASADGDFTTSQISWERYTGQGWEQHRGSGWVNAIQANDRADVVDRWTTARASRRQFQVACSLWHRESQSYRSCLTEAVPVMGDDGAVIEWVGTVSDVEEQQRAKTALDLAEAHLVEQKHELELIYESAPLGMSLVDRELRFLRINSRLAEINGFPVDYHLGKTVTEVLDALRDQLEAIYRQVFETGTPVLDVEIVGETPASQETRTWLASFYPVNADGEPVRAVSAIVQDITSRKQLEQELRASEQAAYEANESKSAFLANMSHEIRTPMAAILGYADVLLGHLKDPDNRNCVLIIQENGQYLLELINDILDLSRIEAGKLDIDIEPCSLTQLVTDLQSLMNLRASEKDLKLLATFETSVPELIPSDPIRLRQVLINLIGNAIKFTEQGTVTLSIRCHVEGDESIVVEFSVIDTGIGMTEGQQTRLFKPFSQGDASVTRNFGGSGLGLAISHRLVSMLDGSLSFESQVGKGSTFRVRLPVSVPANVPMVQPEPQAVSPTEIEPAPAPQQLDCRVLIVDDRRDVRHITQHFLERAGAVVVTAENGQQGVDVAIASRDAGEPFDLIVMDIQMPYLDGLEATARLRAEGVDWPIIALTADAMTGDRERCLNGGCDDYLAKPIDHAELVGTVRRYVHELSKVELIRTRQR